MAATDQPVLRPLTGYPVYHPQVDRDVTGDLASMDKFDTDDFAFPGIHPQADTPWRRFVHHPMDVTDIHQQLLRLQEILAEHQTPIQPPPQRPNNNTLRAIQRFTHEDYIADNSIFGSEFIYHKDIRRAGFNGDYECIVQVALYSQTLRRCVCDLVGHGGHPIYDPHGILAHRLYAAPLWNRTVYTAPAKEIYKFVGGLFEVCNLVMHYIAEVSALLAHHEPQFDQALLPNFFMMFNAVFTIATANDWWDNARPTTWRNLVLTNGRIIAGIVDLFSARRYHSEEELDGSEKPAILAKWILDNMEEEIAPLARLAHSGNPDDEATRKAQDLFTGYLRTAAMDGECILLDHEQDIMAMLTKFLIFAPYEETFRAFLRTANCPIMHTAITANDPPGWNFKHRFLVELVDYATRPAETNEVWEAQCATNPDPMAKFIALFDPENPLQLDCVGYVIPDRHFIRDLVYAYPVADPDEVETQKSWASMVARGIGNIFFGERSIHGVQSGRLKNELDGELLDVSDCDKRCSFAIEQLFRVADVPVAEAADPPPSNEEKRQIIKDSLVSVLWRAWLCRGSRFCLGHSSVVAPNFTAEPVKLYFPRWLVALTQSQKDIRIPRYYLANFVSIPLHAAIVRAFGFNVARTLLHNWHARPRAIEQEEEEPDEVFAERQRMHRAYKEVRAESVVLAVASEMRWIALCLNRNQRTPACVVQTKVFGFLYGDGFNYADIGRVIYRNQGLGWASSPFRIRRTALATMYPGTATARVFEFAAREAANAPVQNSYVDVPGALRQLIVSEYTVVAEAPEETPV